MLGARHSSAAFMIMNDEKTRDWSRAPPAHRGWHSRHYLPHFDSQDVIQFVTFRLADSLPAEALARLRDADRAETLRHEMLDRGWGACWLKSEPIARLVEEAFLEFDAVRYRLHAWTVMP